MTTPLGSLIITTLAETPWSQMPGSDLALAAPLDVEVFPHECSSSFSLPRTALGGDLWPTCGLGEDHAVEDPSCTCGGPAWVGVDQALAEAAAVGIMPAVIGEIHVRGLIAVHTAGVRAAESAVVRVRLTPWCDRCHAAGAWETGQAVLVAEGPQSAALRIRCDVHAGAAAALDPEELGEWLGVDVLVPTSALGRQLRDLLPVPADPPTRPVPACADRTVGGLRMGQRGFVSVQDIAVTTSGELVVRRSAPAPQVPLADGPVIAVKRPVGGALEAYPTAEALAAVLAVGPVRLRGAVRPLCIPHALDIAAPAATPRTGVAADGIEGS